MEATFNAIDALVLSAVYQNNKIDLVQWIGMIDFYERKNGKAQPDFMIIRKKARIRVLFCAVGNCAQAISPCASLGGCLRRSFANRCSKECHVWI